MPCYLTKFVVTVIFLLTGIFCNRTKSRGASTTPKKRGKFQEECTKCACKNFHLDFIYIPKFIHKVCFLLPINKIVSVAILCNILPSNSA